MKKMYEKFFYGQHNLEYQELIEEFTEKLKKKTYTPQYEKIGGVVKDIYTRDFDEREESKDQILLNTIMITQMARYYWMMGNFEVGTRAYEKQYEQILHICKQVYFKEWYYGDIKPYDDIEPYFKLFTTRKVLDEYFYFPKKDFWYNGGYDAWQYGYAKDIKNLEKNGYAHSELWSVDWTMMQWLAIRMEAFIKEYEDNKFCIIIDKKELTRLKKMLKFVKAYAEHGTYCYHDKQFGLLDKRSKKGKISQKKLDALWAEFGECIPRLWW